jgi:hypothetical protein
VDGDGAPRGTGDLLQRAVHLAALRVLVDERRSELHRLAQAEDALAVIGFGLDRSDALARVAFSRASAGLAADVACAAAELREAEVALRTAVLDDAWTPADDLDWPA